MNQWVFYTLLLLTIGKDIAAFNVAILPALLRRL
jgi:hypothetical protein